MNQAVTQIFSKIPPEELNIAIQCGLLFGTAASIFYLFFGRLLSIPELLGICLKKPTCKSINIQLHNLEIHSLSSQDSFSSQPSFAHSTTNTYQPTILSTMKSISEKYRPYVSLSQALLWE